MVEENLLFLDNIAPGIQRDGTPFKSNAYIDGQWMRFYDGRPQKMGGYSLISEGDSERIHNIYGIPKDLSLDIYQGRASSLIYTNVDYQGTVGTQANRTPTSFASNTNNRFVFDTYSLANPFETYIIVNVNANRDNINGQNEGAIYYGNIDDTTPLLQFGTGPNYTLASGGIVVIENYIFAYGNNGYIEWNDPFDFTGMSNFDTIAGSKIVAAKKLRGSGSSAGLFWSTDSLIRVFADPTTTAPNRFSSEIVRANTSILAPDSIVEADQMFFWVGNGEFLVYNGTVQTLENTRNSNYFFDNLNFDEAQKISGFYNPRFKEICWHYPRGSSTENNASVLYNIKTGEWYDNQISRTSAFFSSSFPYPIMADAETLNDPIIPSNQVYGLWLHEFGRNKQQFSVDYAIESYFETNYLMLGRMNPTMDRQMRITRIEPDFVQTSQDMQLEIKKRAFVNSTSYTSIVYTFNDSTEKIDFPSFPPNNMGRILNLRFRSNTLDDFYEMGDVIIHYTIGDKNPYS